MKKLLLILMCCVLCGGPAWAVRQKSQEAMAEIRQALDMKIFHDKTFVKNMIQRMREDDESGITSDPDLMNEVGYEGLFTKKDSDILRRESAHKVIRARLIQTPWDEQQESIDKDPFGVFIGLIENQEVPDLKAEELKNLNSVDKQVIPEMIQMVTESGPDVGAGAVPVAYDDVAVQ